MLKQQRNSKSTVPADQRPPDAELDVLAHLWRKRRATAREVREALFGYRPMTHGSVVNLLKRLESRGLVSRSRGSADKAFVYHPTPSTRPAYQQIVRNVAERIFGGNSLEMVSTLLGAKLLTAEELDQLEQMLGELRRKRKTRRGES